MLHKYMPGDTRERIKDLLKEHNMTQDQLAEKLGMSGSTLNRYISGQTEKLSTENIVAMAKIFDVSTDFLLCLTDIPFKTNYDLERLGFSVDAAKMLLRKEFDMEVLNTLLTHPDFLILTRQLKQLRDGTVAAGFASMNQMIDSSIALLKEYGENCPSKRYAAKQVTLDIQALKQPEYRLDTAAIEATFQHFINDFRQGSEAYMAESRKLTSSIMDRLTSNIKKNMKDPIKMRGITPEMIVDEIMKGVSTLDADAEAKEKLRTGLLGMFESAQNFRE